MPRVVGIDPGTVSLDAVALDGGRPVLEVSVPTAEAVADPAAFAGLLRDLGPVDLCAAPSGYGLPLVPGPDLTEEQRRLLLLAPPGEPGGIGGLGALVRALALAGLPLIFLPGVIHLPTVPGHRKLNRVDMGTPDKLAAVALGLAQALRDGAAGPREVHFILLELGGAFSAAVAVEGGEVVDGMGGTSGPIGARAAGALDGEVAMLASPVTKATLFRGGVDDLPRDLPGRDAIADDALVEGAAKAVLALGASAPSARRVLVSGRLGRRDALVQALRTRLPGHRVERLEGFSSVVKEAAQGAALLADGLAGGASARLVEALRLREASGTVLDHLLVVTRAQARARLGLGG